MIRLAASNYYNRTFFDSSNNSNTNRPNMYYIPEVDDESELWGPHLNRFGTSAAFGDINLEFYLKKYWSRIKEHIITFINLFSTIGTYTQTTDQQVKFLTPNKYTAWLNPRHAMTWETSPGEFIVEMPINGN